MPWVLKWHVVFWLVQRGHSKKTDWALSGKSKCLRNGADSAEDMPPSELDNIPWATVQRQIAVLAPLCFHRRLSRGATGRMIEHQSATIRANKDSTRMRSTATTGNNSQQSH
ncbi:hypothetical protein BDV06DRAFT_207145, partial [Aspergillus oleicola]